MWVHWLEQLCHSGEGCVGGCKVTGLGKRGVGEIPEPRSSVSVSVFVVLSLPPLCFLPSLLSSFPNVIFLLFFENFMEHILITVVV